MATRSYPISGEDCMHCCCECTITMGMAIVGSPTCTSPSGSGLEYDPADCTGDEDTTLAEAMATTNRGFTRQGPTDIVAITAPLSIRCGASAPYTYYYFSHWKIYECIDNESTMTPGPGGTPPTYYCVYNQTVEVDLCDTGDCDLTAIAYYDAAVCVDPGDECSFIESDVECPP